MIGLPAAAQRALRDVVGPRHLITDPEVLHGRVRDWTGRHVGATPALVRPGTVDEAAAIVEVARTHGIALVPQGGNTGLVGGSVPLDGEVLVGMERFDRIDDVDPVAGQLTAGAGVTIDAVHAAAGAVGWSYGVDLAARQSATVGGTVATNAGGLHVVRNGPTRRQVLGVRAGLGDGTRVDRLSGLVKDNTGYDLSGLLCGSEGTLGLITHARLALVPPRPGRAAALVGFASVRDAVATGQGLRGALDDLDAVELILAPGMALVSASLGAPMPFASIPPAALVVEAAAPDDPTDRLGAALQDAPGILEVAVATEPRRRGELWRLREGHTEAIATLGVAHKLDVTLPSAVLAEFIEVVPQVVGAVAPDASTWCFGHVGDGNVHVNVTGVPADDPTVDDAVLGAVVDAGGSISAEHGIGTAKKVWFARALPEAERAAMAAVKRALDPDRVCNPNVLGI